MNIDIDESAYQSVIEQMKNYRPSLSETVIKNIIENQLSSRFPPLSETEQDVWWAYLRALKGGRDE